MVEGEGVVAVVLAVLAVAVAVAHTKESICMLLLFVQLVFSVQNACSMYA